MKAVIYLHPKFRWNISIHGWDKSTSGFGWWTAAMFEFYFQFRFWPTVMCNYPHVVLHPPANFLSNRKNICGLLTSYRFFKMAVIKLEI